MDRKIRETEDKVKNFLGIKKMPDYKVVTDESLEKREAFNKKVDRKYIITISPDNLAGLKHELIHLALKRFSYDDLDVNLPVPKKYEKDDKTVRFMEYLTIVFEIKMGNPEKIEENLNSYEKYGFSRIKAFYNIIGSNNLRQSFIGEIINKVNSP